MNARQEKTTARPDVTTAGEQYPYVDQTKPDGTEAVEQPAETKVPAKDDSSAKDDKSSARK